MRDWRRGKYGFRLGEDALHVWLLCKFLRVEGLARSEFEPSLPRLLAPVWRFQFFHSVAW